MNVARVTEQTLQREISQLVAERQDLRSSGAASEAALEENRRRIGELHRELGRLFIELYLPRAQPQAA